MSTEARCHEILHCGEGPLGDHVDVLFAICALDAARQAAAHFDEIEMREHDWDESEMDGSTRYIEVDWHGEKRRVEVVCTLVRRYEGTAMKMESEA